MRPLARPTLLPCSCLSGGTQLLPRQLTAHADPALPPGTISSSGVAFKVSAVATAPDRIEVDLRGPRGLLPLPRQDEVLGGRGPAGGTGHARPAQGRDQERRVFRQAGGLPPRRRRRACRYPRQPRRRVHAAAEGQVPGLRRSAGCATRRRPRPSRSRCRAAIGSVSAACRQCGSVSGGHRRALRLRSRIASPT